MPGNLGWRSLSNSKRIWQISGQRAGPVLKFNHDIPSRLLRRPCPGEHSMLADEALAASLAGKVHKVLCCSAM